MAAYLTLADVCERLKVSERTVRRWIARGELRAVRAGAVIRVTEAALTDWEQAHETGSRTEATSAPAATPIVARLVALPVGPLPAGYQPVFGPDGGLATSAASPAARRSGSAKGKKKAV